MNPKNSVSGCTDKPRRLTGKLNGGPIARADPEGDPRGDTGSCCGYQEEYESAMAFATSPKKLKRDLEKFEISKFQTMVYSV